MEFKKYVWYILADVKEQGSSKGTRTEVMEVFNGCVIRTTHRTGHTSTPDTSSMVLIPDEIAEDIFADAAPLK